jgi:tetratricopeptide (TPR) repeat protein
MNNTDRDKTAAENGHAVGQGKLSDLQRLMKLALNSFTKGKYTLTIDYCRKAVSAINGSELPDFAAEAYYIWCLSYLRMEKFDDARKVCYDARLKLGNYLDLVYFEILIAAVKGENEKIPRLVESFVELHEDAKDKFNPLKEKTHDKIGEVLLMAGQSLEQSGDVSGAIEIYNKYLRLFPDDSPIKDRVEVLTNQNNRIAEKNSDGQK